MQDASIDDMIKDWQDEFPINTECCYLNHAAVAPWPQRSGEAVKKFATENVTYGASYYPRWIELENQLRQQLATLLDAPKHAIALVKNTSEALSFVAYGISWQAGDVVVISDHEFPSNRIVWESLSQFGVIVKMVSLPDDNPEQELLAAIQQKPKLISVSAVQYANGQVLDLAKLGQACQENKVLFCVDAIQMVGAMPLSLTEIQADFAMADGHKWMLGSEGLGFFYIRPEVMDQLSLQEYGWHMIEHAGNYDLKQWQVAKDAKRFECGSPNMLGAQVLSASLSVLLEVGMKRVHAGIIDRINYLEQGLRNLGCTILTPEPAQTTGLTIDQRRSGIMLFQSNKIESHDLYKQMMSASVICACRGGGVRLSPHFHTTDEVLDGALEVIQRLITP